MMKKHLFLPLIILAVLLFCVPAAAEIMYAANDTVPVLREQNINSEVAGTYRGGDKILIEGITPDLLWASTLIAAKTEKARIWGGYRCQPFPTPCLHAIALITGQNGRSFTLPHVRLRDCANEAAPYAASVNLRR